MRSGRDSHSSLERQNREECAAGSSKEKRGKWAERGGWCRVKITAVARLFKKERKKSWGISQRSGTRRTDRKENHSQYVGRKGCSKTRNQALQIRQPVTVFLQGGAKTNLAERCPHGYPNPKPTLRRIGDKDSRNRNTEQAVFVRTQKTPDEKSPRPAPRKGKTHCAGKQKGGQGTKSSWR